MKMEIKDSGLYIDMTHDAREYKNKIMALNNISTVDSMIEEEFEIAEQALDYSDEFVDAWSTAMADSMQTLDNVVPLEFEPDCPICKMIMDEVKQM